jgi:stage V sporulation protein R
VHLQKIWTRPVHIETSLKGDPKIVSFDGSEHSEQEITEESAEVVEA